MRSSLKLNNFDETLAILDTPKIDRKRKSMDDGKNRSGNILLELCRGNNLFIVNGRIGDDYLESGRLTCRNSIMKISIKSGSSAVLLLKSPSKQIYL
jgi:hypothetical protein